MAVSGCEAPEAANGTGSWTKPWTTHIEEVVEQRRCSETPGPVLLLYTNIGTVPESSVLAIVVAAYLPLAVELLNPALKRRRAETIGETGNEMTEITETNNETERPVQYY